jgi:N-methylhydantoinase A
VSVRRGLDPRDFPLVVAGGAGPIHAAAIARELEIPLLVVPRESSIFCAAGMLMSDFKHDFVRAYKTQLAEIDGDRLAGLLREMEEEGRAVLARELVEPDRIEVSAALDLRYVGQWHELTMPVATTDPAAVAAAFHAEHDRLFGYSSPEMAVEQLAVRVSARGTTTKPSLRELASGTSDAEAARRESREVWSPAERAMLETPVYDGLALGPGSSIAGPAVVELANTTIVVLAGFDLTVDRFGAFVLSSGERGRELATHLTAFSPAG